VTKELRLNEVHNPSFEAQVLKLCEVDTLEMIRQFGGQFIDTPCPVCSSSKRHLEVSVWGLDYQRCEDCELVYISPCPPDSVRSWYLEHSSGLKFWREKMPPETIESRRAMYRDRANYIGNAVSRFGGSRDRIAEVGAGNGELAEAIRSLDLFEEIVLIEPQPLDISLPGCTVLHSELSAVTFAEPASVVVAFEVLEHINDPKIFLRDLKNLVGDKGLLVMSTPNVDGLEISRMGQHSNAIMFDHVRLFNPRSIAYLLNSEGWELICIETPGQFDVDSICGCFESGLIDLAQDPALRFICKSDPQVRSQFQKFLQNEQLSSHMKLVAKKRERI